MPTLRHKGRFAKLKVIDKKSKCVAAMNRAKKYIKSFPNHVRGNPNLCAGRRIVELKELGKNLRCCKCNQTLSLDNVTTERQLGLNTILLVKCDQCFVDTKVATSKIHVTRNLSKYSDVNSKAVLGAVHAGVGRTALNKILACLNIPEISAHLFKRYEREFGPAIEEAAKESCKQAADDERRLVIANLHKLCVELPTEIVDKVYPHFRNLRSSNNTYSESPTNHSDVPPINSVDFDAALGEIINIIVSYDMGWSKRGNGRSYNSLNGYGSVIGLLSGKILDFATRNRKCKLCDIGRNKTDHDCRKNFQGSAKAMEPDVGAVLVNESAILKENGLEVRVVIGDEDSSTIVAVRRGSSKTIFKLSDKNHLKKSFTRDLYAIQKSFNELKKKDTIPHLKKCFGYAIAQNKGKSAALADTLRSIPDHVFNQHENCGNWCNHAPGNNTKQQTVILKSPELYEKLKEIFSKYAENAYKFSVAASSQANESLNNIMAHKAPKNCCYSRSESSDYRFASAVCSKNVGETALLSIQEKLLLSPGRYTASYAARKDATKLQRSKKEKLPSSKKRRIELARDNENSRKKMEKSEGVQYQSNCGFTENREGLDNLFDSQIHDMNLLNIPITLESCNVVYFDLETSGLYRSDEIWQIAAQYEDRVFSVYLNPTKDGNPDASKHTGLKNIDGELFLHHKKVESVTSNEALHAFQQFLSFSSKPCILVAHNAAFDTSHFIRALIKNSMLTNFKNIAGFCDTLSLLRKRFPERRGEGMFKLSKLAEDFLNVNTTENFHEASYDVKVLEELTSSFIDKKDLYKNTKKFLDCVMHERELLNQTKTLPFLQLLKTIVSDGMLKKIARQQITDKILIEKYENEGKEGIVRLLSEKMCNNKPRVTKDKRVLTKIIVFFEEKKNCV